ncbi:MAG: hypothetical protein NTW86_20470 [Candidatus Sumerlaeota bacterium]|nr:hypothetical protein [Candidatus Sumerlaeota bacterium]
MPRIRQSFVDGVEVWILEAEGAMEAAVAPAFGGQCSSLRLFHEGGAMELLHDANVFSGRRMGGRNPILFPATGRLFLDGELGRYRHKGQIYAMDIHGFAKDMAWKVAGAEADTRSARLTIELESSAETRAAYPYDFLVSLTYELAGQRLRLDAEIENRSPEPMPFSFGYHPYFRAPIDPSRSSREACQVVVPGGRYWEMRDGQPSGRLLPLPPELDFRAGVRLPDQHLEWVIGGLDPAPAGKPARTDVVDRDSGVIVGMEFDPARLETVVVYSPSGAPYVCPEPRTGLPGALSDGAPAPPTGQVLPPGQRTLIRTAIVAESV